MTRFSYNNTIHNTQEINLKFVGNNRGFANHSIVCIKRIVNGYTAGRLAGEGWIEKADSLSILATKLRTATNFKLILTLQDLLWVISCRAIFIEGEELGIWFRGCVDYGFTAFSKPNHDIVDVKSAVVIVFTAGSRTSKVTERSTKTINIVLVHTGTEEINKVATTEHIFKINGNVIGP